MALKRREAQRYRCATRAESVCSLLQLRWRQALRWRFLEAASKSAPEKVRAVLKDCGLTLHPVKIKLVHCKDEDRLEQHEHTSFNFLSYTFRLMWPKEFRC